MAAHPLCAWARRFLLPLPPKVNNLRTNSPPAPKEFLMTQPAPHPLSAQDCLVAVMIAVSASDENIRKYTAKP